MNAGGLDEPDICKRNSDASTVDAEMDSEDEGQHSDRTSSLQEPGSKFHLFDCISDEQKYSYCKLRDSLREIYRSLEQELEPVCVKDCRGIIPKSVDLNSVANSLITRRRASALIQ